MRAEKSRQEEDPLQASTPEFSGPLSSVYSLATLIDLSPDHPEYKDVARHFNDTWKSTRCAQPRAIVRIQRVKNAYLQQRFDGFREELRLKNAQNVTQLHWHGTSRATVKFGCGSGPLGNACGRVDSCAQCAILNLGFDVKRASDNGLFGKGIYTALSSSKADGYNAGSELSNGVRSVLLCKMEMGHVFTSDRYLREQHVRSCPFFFVVSIFRCGFFLGAQLKKAPEGFDSVQGVSGPKCSVQDTEFIAYHNDQVVPEYVIHYQTDEFANPRTPLDKLRLYLRLCQRRLEASDSKMPVTPEMRRSLTEHLQRLISLPQIAWTSSVRVEVGEMVATLVSLGQPEPDRASFNVLLHSVASASNSSAL
jgi:hypothetical protein